MKKNTTSIFYLLAVLLTFCLLLPAPRSAAGQPEDPDYLQRERLLKAYFASKKAYAANDLPVLKTTITNFQAEAKKLRLKGLQFEDMARLKKVRDSIGLGTIAVQQVVNIYDAKDALSTLGTQLWSMLEKMPFSTEPMYLQYCPMEEAYWISDEKQIFNPFSPEIMPKCGYVVKGLTQEDYKVEACCH